MSVLGLVLLTSTASAQTWPEPGYRPPSPPIPNERPSYGPILPARPNEPPATGQFYEPEFVPYVNDLQLFDQPDLTTYGRGPRRAQGWFGSTEYLNWTQSAAPRTTIGQSDVQNVYHLGAITENSQDYALVDYSVFVLRIRTVTPPPPGIPTTTFTPISSDDSTYIDPTPGNRPSLLGNNEGVIAQGAIEQTSGLDTSFAGTADFTGGGRFEFGRMVEGRGWMIGGFGWTNTPTFNGSNVSVNYDNAPVGFVDERGVDPLTGIPFLGQDGYDDDLDGDSVYGRSGRDRGTGPRVVNGLTVYSITPDGIPDPEPAGPEARVDWDDAVRLPTRYLSLRLENRIELASVEAMRMWEVYVGPYGGLWEAFAGPRGINIRDQFQFYGTGPAGTVTTVVNNVVTVTPTSPVASYFDTDAHNYLFGGQFGGRWSHQRGRVQFGLEGRGFLGANFQHVTQQGQLGDPPTDSGVGSASNMLLPSQFSHRANQTEFSPAAELRLNLKYQAFRSVYLQAGYSAFFAHNIARGAQMTYYSMPDMGILEDENHSIFLVHGLNLGLVINR